MTKRLRGTEAGQEAVDELCSEVKRLHTSTAVDKELIWSTPIHCAPVQQQQQQQEQQDQSAPDSEAYSERQDGVSAATWHDYQAFNALLGRLHFERLRRQQQ
ncbi:hypothetical protein ACKKBG_A27565 [Auxenochlorella protothecoides x Auxenochlorella symbiontica]